MEGGLSVTIAKEKIVERGFRGSCETWQLCRLRENGSSIDIAPLGAICAPGSGGFMLYLESWSVDFVLAM